MARIVVPTGGRNDCATTWPRAGIDYRDAEDRVFDFHAQRHQYVTNLCEADVHPRTAQELARHSTIELTMKRSRTCRCGTSSERWKRFPSHVDRREHHSGGRQGTDDQVVRAGDGQAVQSGAKLSKLDQANEARESDCRSEKTPAITGENKRRAWDSNPQPVARHHISSVAASHSLTLRGILLKRLSYQRLHPIQPLLVCAV